MDKTAFLIMFSLIDTGLTKVLALLKDSEDFEEWKIQKFANYTSVLIDTKHKLLYLVEKKIKDEQIDYFHYNELADLMQDCAYIEEEISEFMSLNYH